MGSTSCSYWCKKSVVVGGKSELVVPVVLHGVIPADVVVVVLTPGPADPAEAEGVGGTLAVVVVAVLVVLIGEEMVVCFCIFTSKFNSESFEERD